MSEDLANLLRSRGLKVTPQRIAILKLLSSGGHYTIEHVHDKLRDIEPGISISTVYNTLSTLTRLGVLRSFEANGKTWYEIAKHPHLNVICENTGQIIDIDVDLTWIMDELMRRGIKVKDLNIIVNGDCSKMEGK
ncbi:Fur family transcriptional regulator [Caldivirga maquilingensis]|uniref:Ferric uptake regulator, Fur family n=1 Tax=Caldivirga maquilingensis (strain ATCC 700844 / DSM 13496 / JCM 10307 / IC-167) TaxID=397948 RepID=A8M9N1_CALMQ|nr:Fur family transcriptional regulator [Caldivirga maquilingensis]ABW00912.1 ferric uptake regulator, Fur family [Caldivirga maquilingensis IC-167]